MAEDRIESFIDFKAFDKDFDRMKTTSEMIAKTLKWAGPKFTAWVLRQYFNYQIPRTFKKWLKIG